MKILDIERVNKYFSIVSSEHVFDDSIDLKIPRLMFEKLSLLKEDEFGFSEKDDLLWKVNLLKSDLSIVKFGVCFVFQNNEDIEKFNNINFGEAQFEDLIGFLVEVGSRLEFIKVMEKINGDLLFCPY